MQRKGRRQATQQQEVSAGRTATQWAGPHLHKLPDDSWDGHEALQRHIVGDVRNDCTGQGWKLRSTQGNAYTTQGQQARSVCLTKQRLQGRCKHIRT